MHEVRDLVFELIGKYQELHLMICRLSIGVEEITIEHIKNKRAYIRDLEHKLDDWL